MRDGKATRRASGSTAISDTRRGGARGRRRSRTTEFLAAGLALASFCGVLDSALLAEPRGGDPERSLFVFGGAAVAGDPSDAGVVRSRVVSADLGLLASADPGERLRLHVFDDVSVVAEFTSAHWTNGTCVSLNGSVEGSPGSQVSFVVNDGEMAGIMRLPGVGTFKMRATEGGLGQVTELDEGAMPPCITADGGGGDGGGGDWADPPDGAPAPDPCDNGSTIDVLVLYTALARSAAGGTAAIEAEAQLAIDSSNTAYANSDIAPRLRLVHLAETSYNEAGSYFDHLNYLTYSDGVMDEAHTLRDTYGADMVALLVDDSQYCGLAWVMTSPGPGFATHAFSVTTWFCAAGNLSFPHELGHNMGCCHDHDNCSGGAYSYSWGHRFYGNGGPQYRTVMSYSPGSRIPYFSNPDIDYDGQPTGVVSGPTAADNARTIDENASIMANFRCATDSNPDGLFIGSAGGSWLVPGNWGAGVVPGPTTPVILPVAVTLTGGAAFAEDVTIENGGSLTVLFGGSLAAQDVVLESGSNLFLSDVSISANSVTIESGSTVGTLDATSNLIASTVTIESGGLLTGIGTVTGDVVNNGEIRPGLQMADFDIDGDFTQSASGTFIAEVESLETPDRLVVTGTATLGGTLDLVILNGQTPQVGECFTLLTAAAISGSFATVDIPYLTFGEEIEFTMTATDATACVQSLGRAGIVGEMAGDQFARAIANAGDVDQDGYDDLIIGAPYNDENGDNAGKVYVYSGRDGSLIWSKRGSQAGARFGYAVAGAGDANEDGAADFVVGAPYRNNKKGRIKLYSGADGSTLKTLNGAANNDRFGHSVAGGIDINADGADDFIVGAPYHDSSARNAGRVIAYSGRTGGILGILDGEDPGDLFGWCVAALGKSNGDANGDFLVGAPRNDDRGSNAGKVSAYSGRNFTRLFALKGKRAGDQFGRVIAGLGRVDADGRDDFAVGSPYYDKSGGLNAGRVDVYSGRDGSRFWSKNGELADDRFGWSIAAGGDLDGDGLADVLIGAPRQDAMGLESGRLYCKSGAGGANIATIEADAAGDQIGYSAAGLGDLDDSGLDDLAVGAPMNDTAAAEAGRVYFIFSPPADAMMALDGADAPAEDDAYGRLDLDGDGEVALGDLYVFLDAWSEDQPEADLDLDGVVDELDLLLLMESWR